MQTHARRFWLEELSTTDIVAGILINLPTQTFQEKRLYTFLEQTGDSRFRIGRAGNIHDVRTVLSFFEMGRIVVPTYEKYYIVQAMKDFVKEELKKRQVLPRHATNLETLAKSFASSSH
ncbi:MAG: hypothetical protein AAB783_00495 [Patescibacteria group bacterium]